MFQIKAMEYNKKVFEYKIKFLTMLNAENYTALYDYDKVLITYNICCISVSSSSLVVCIPSIHLSTSYRQDLLVLCKNRRWVSSASLRSAPIFVFVSTTSRRPVPFPAERASTSTAFSSALHPKSLKDCACSSRSVVDPLSRPSSTYHETDVIAGIESAFS